MLATVPYAVTLRKYLTTRIEYAGDVRKHLGQLVDPNPVLDFLMNISKIATDPRADFERSVSPRWSPANVDAPSDDTDNWLLRVAGTSTELADRSADIRAALTAYSQAVATPRPELSKLALWQRISPSALRHRYNEQHVQAVRELLQADPLIDIILEPFPSVFESDLRGINSAIDAQLELRKKMREAVSKEFDALALNLLGPLMGGRRDPASERTARLIDELGPSMETALQRRAPDLVPVFHAWHERFLARPVKPEDVKAKAVRVRRPTK